MESDSLVYKRENRKARNLRTLKWHRNNPQRSYWLAAKGRAKRANLPFNLEVSDIIFPKCCPILGIKLKFTSGGRTPNTPSLDRTIASKGYVKGNVHIISWKANRLKCDASLEELKKLVAYMENNT